MQCVSTRCLDAFVRVKTCAISHGGTILIPICFFSKRMMWRSTCEMVPPLVVALVVLGCSAGNVNLTSYTCTPSCENCSEVSAYQNSSVCATAAGGIASLLTSCDPLPESRQCVEVRKFNTSQCAVSLGYSSTSIVMDVCMFLSQTGDVGVSILSRNPANSSQFVWRTTCQVGSTCSPADCAASTVITLGVCTQLSPFDNSLFVVAQAVTPCTAVTEAVFRGGDCSGAALESSVVVSGACSNGTKLTCSYPPQTLSPTSSPQPTSSPHHSGSKIKPGVVAAIAIGSVAVMLGSVGVWILCSRRRPAAELRPLVS